MRQGRSAWQMPHHNQNLGFLFQRTVASTPTAPALFCQGRAYDFKSLNSLANRFARWLIAQGVSRGQVVGLELPKIVEAYALALACIKIGAPSRPVGGF